VGVRASVRLLRRPFVASCGRENRSARQTGQRHFRRVHKKFSVMRVVIRQLAPAAFAVARSGVENASQPLVRARFARSKILCLHAQDVLATCTALQERRRRLLRSNIFGDVAAVRARVSLAPPGVSYRKA